MKILNSLKAQRPPDGENWITFNSAENEILCYEPIGKTWDGSGLTAKNFRERLDKADRNRDLHIRINSKGGDVWEGMAIKSMLDQWPGRVVASIDGIAASTASWMALGADEIRAAKNSQIFAHDAIAFGFGNAEQMRKTADRLDTTSDQIAGMYAEKSGKTQKEMRRYMRDETLWTADEAHKLGLVDTIVDTKALRNFSDEDLTEIRDRLRMLNRTQNEPAPEGAANNNTPIMNRDQMLALLKKHGVTVSNEATDEQLQAALNKLLETKTPAAPPANLPAAPPTDNKIVSLEEFQAMKNRLDKLAEADNAAKRQRITNEVEKLIANDQLPANLKDKSIELAMANEDHLNVLKAMPSRPPGAEPVKTSNLAANASPKEVANHFGTGFENAMKSWQSGNDVNPKDIASASSAKGAFYWKHRNELIEMFNTNTVPAGLKHQAILQEVVVDFARKVLNLRMFANTYSNVPLFGTNKVNVKYYDLDSSDSVSFVTANGYDTLGNTTTDTREIQIGNNGGNAALLCDRKYIGLSFTSEEIARQPFLDIVRLAKLKADKLASDIVTHVLSVVTAANYGAAAITKQAALFSSDDVAAMKLSCKLWPEAGRSIILDSAYDAALLKDTAIKSAMNFGGADAIREGKIPKLFGFDYYENPTIPSNGENLTGFAAFMSAILFATAPVPPVEEVRNAGVTYQILTDPVSGVALEYRSWGDGTLDTAKRVMECNYGFQKGNGTAIKRIVSA